MAGCMQLTDQNSDYVGEGGRRRSLSFSSSPDYLFRLRAKLSTMDSAMIKFRNGFTIPFLEVT